MEGEEWHTFWLIHGTEETRNVLLCPECTVNLGLYQYGYFTIWALFLFEDCCHPDCGEAEGLLDQPITYVPACT